MRMNSTALRSVIVRGRLASGAPQTTHVPHFPVVKSPNVGAAHSHEPRKGDSPLETHLRSLIQARAARPAVFLRVLAFSQL